MIEFHRHPPAENQKGKPAPFPPQATQQVPRGQSHSEQDFIELKKDSAKKAMSFRTGLKAR
jgi:hypothetical protein